MSRSSPGKKPNWRGDASRRSEAASSRSKWPRLAILGVVLVAIASVATAVVWSLRPRKTPTLLTLATLKEGRPTVAADLSWLRDQVSGSTTGKNLANDDFDLAPLGTLRADDSLILYVSAPARIVGDRVQLIRDESSATTSLDDLLAAVARCKSRGKLLLLDLYNPPRMDAASGVPLDNLARAVSDRLKRLKDKSLSVITSASISGQTPRDSEIRGRSVFADYVALGLGEETAVADANRDKVVTAKELHAYVAPRVDDWAQVHFGTGQLPGWHAPEGGGELTLAYVSSSTARDARRLAAEAKSGGKSSAPEKAGPSTIAVAEPPALPYPSDLKAGWERRDRWRESRFFEVAPRPYHRLETALRDAERAWRLGVSAAVVSRQLEPVLALAATNELEWAIWPPGQAPQPRSLAQAALSRFKTDPALDAAVSELAMQILEKPPKELADAWDKLTATFSGDDRARSFALASAVMLAARGTDRKLPPLTARLPRLNEWLATRQREPRFAETYALRRLADVASDWPDAVLRDTLESACQGEDVDAHPQAFARFPKEMDQAAALRHRAEVLIQAKGFAPDQDAAKAGSEARAAYARLLTLTAPLIAGESVWDGAMARLLDAAPYAERARDAVLPAWRATAEAALEIRKKLTSGDPLSFSSVDSLVRGLRTLDDLCGSGPVEAVIKASRDPVSSNDRDYRALDGLLGSMAPNTADRIKLVEASRSLAARLDERHRGHPFTDASTPSQDAKAEAAPIRAELARILLTLAGGVPPSGEPEPSGSQTWIDAWTRLVGTVSDRERLARAAPAWLSGGTLDVRDASPTWWTAKRTEARSLYQWLADRATFESNDLDGSRFLRDSAAAFRTSAGAVGRTPSLEIGLSRTLDLSRAASVAGTLSIDPTVEVAGAPPALVRAVAPDDRRLKVTLAQPDGAAPAAEGASLADVALPAKLELGVSWSPAAVPKDARPPRVSGLLVQVDWRDRTYTRKVPIVGLPAGDEPEILLAAEGGGPAQAPATLSLRPLAKPQGLALFVRNPGEAKRTVVFEVSAAGVTARSAPTPLGPGETAPFKPVGVGKLPPDLPVLTGPIILRVLDEAGAVQLARKDVVLEILDPADYVEVVAGLSKYSPKSPSNRERNRVEIQVRPRGLPSGGPASVVMLNLSEAADPAQKPKDQSLTDRLDPASPDPVRLYAEGFTPRPGAISDAAFYLDVDNVSRALKFRANLAPSGPDRLLRIDERPSVLPLDVPRYVDTGESKQFDLVARVDNGPPDSFVEVSLRIDGDARREIARERFAGPRRRIVRCGVDPALGLVVEAVVADWRWPVKLAGERGPRVLSAVLYDGSQPPRELAKSTERIFLDDEAPRDLRVNAPSSLPSGTPTLDIELSGVSESEIVSAGVYLGKPPKPGAKPAEDLIAATLDKSRGVWIARIALKGDEKGKLDLTAQFVNGIKRDAYATTSVVVLPPETGLGGAKAMKPGRITGTVFEGTRPQPDRDVVLRDGRGGEVDRKKTDSDGNFTFDKVAPGPYQVESEKDFPRKKGKAAAAVSAEQTTKVSVELFD